MAEKDKFVCTTLCQQLKHIAKSNNTKSWATKNTYMRELNKICRDLFNQCQVQKLENIKNIQVKNLIESYIDEGVSVAECKKRLSALRWALSYQNAWLNTKGSKKQCRFTLTNKELGLGNKVFHQRFGISAEGFKQILSAMQGNEKYQSMATLQYYFGLRSREAVLVSQSQLLDAIRTGKLTVKEGAKGGRERKININTKQKAILEDILSKHGKLGYTNNYLFVDKGTKGNVSSVLKGYQCYFYNHQYDMPETLNPDEHERTTSHTLRRSYATNRLIQLRKKFDETQARAIVISELGHGEQRTELLKCYCGGVL